LGAFFAWGGANFAWGGAFFAWGGANFAWVKCILLIKCVLIVNNYVDNSKFYPQNKN